MYCCSNHGDPIVFALVIQGYIKSRLTNGTCVSVGGEGAWSISNKLARAKVAFRSGGSFSSCCVHDFCIKSKFFQWFSSSFDFWDPVLWPSGWCSPFDIGCIGCHILCFDDPPPLCHMVITSIFLSTLLNDGTFDISMRSTTFGTTHGYINDGGFRQYG
jgi:hypothetical protein